MTHKQEAALVLAAAITGMLGLLAFITYRDTVKACDRAPIVAPLHP